MAKTTLTLRIGSLQTEVRQQRQLIHAQMEQIEKQQAVLGIQFRRIADIQAELDLVKATVRLAAPSFAAALIGLSRPMVSLSATAPLNPLSESPGRGTQSGIRPV
jgi:hypothetical protein